MAGSGHKKQWFNSNIFYINGRPMRFYLEGYELCQFHEISRIVEAFGGKLSTPDADTIVFSEPGRYADTDRRRFHIKCLRDSIMQNELQDINKYALPWRIIERQKTAPGLKVPKEEEKPAMATKIDNEITAKLDSQLKINKCSSQPYILIQDCLKNQRNNGLTWPNFNNGRLPREQSTSVVSTSADGKSKTADSLKSQVAVKQRATSDKQHKAAAAAAKRKQIPVKMSDDKPKMAEETLEIIDIVPRKMLVKDVIEISDSEDPEPVNKKSKEALTLEKTSEEPLDWKNLTNFVDAPNAFAVWSSAGPPGPPLSDDEEIVINKKIKTEEHSPITREKAKRINYAGLDASDSDEDRKPRRRGRSKRCVSGSSKGSVKESAI